MLALRAVLRSPPLAATEARRLVALCAGALVALPPVTSGVPGGRLLCACPRMRRRAGSRWRRGRWCRSIRGNRWIGRRRRDRD